MSAYSVHTVTSEDAHAAATRDRVATSNMVLELAVHEAAELIATGHSGRGEWVLVRAGMRAQRILGESTGRAS